METPTRSETELLKSLAMQVAEIASKPEQEEKKRLWTVHNMLHGERPMVLAFPEGSWRELLPANRIKCATRLAAAWERMLRTRIYYDTHFKDDTVVEAILEIPWTFNGSGIGVTVDLVHSDQALGAHTWDPPIKTESDLAKLQVETFQVNRAHTDDIMALAHDIFNGILDIRLATPRRWSLGMTSTLIQLRGLEQMMMDMYDNPGILHAIMKVLHDSHMARLETIEAEKLIEPMNGNQYSGSGGTCWTTELPSEKSPEGLTCSDIWGFAESQELVNVSPAMFEEFAFAYQAPLLKRFGLAAYGCCEPLDQRYDLIKREIPNLRRVSIAPWADQEIAARELSNSYIFSRKPNPAMLAGESFNEDQVRADIRETLEIAKGCCIELVMKDTHTVRNKPERYWRWTEIAREEALNAD